MKYRTSYAEAEELGIIFRTVNTPEYNLDACYYEIIGGDGEWHTVIFYMMDDASWNHFIMNMGFIPFVYAENSAQQTIDMAWIKIYQNDPTDLYADSLFGGMPDDDETEEPDEETTVEDTQAPDGEATDPAVTTEAPTEEPVEKKGCGSVMSFGAVAILSAMAAAVALKKKD